MFAFPINGFQAEGLRNPPIGDATELLTDRRAIDWTRYKADSYIALRKALWSAEPEESLLAYRVKSHQHSEVPVKEMSQGVFVHCTICFISAFPRSG